MINSKKILSCLMAFVVCFVFMPVAGISQDSTMKDHKMKDDHMMKNQTIVQIASQKDNLSTLVKALKSTGLDQALSKKGPFTVFAPTNDAFDALPEGTLNNLMKPENKDKLAKILRYHVVAGSVMAGDLKDGQSVKTIEGNEASVSMKNGTMINDAKVIKADIEASNGVIHVINKVMMPSSDKMMKKDHMKNDDENMKEHNKGHQDGSE